MLTTMLGKMRRMRMIEGVMKLRRSKKMRSRLNTILQSHYIPITSLKYTNITDAFGINVDTPHDFIIHTIFYNSYNLLSISLCLLLDNLKSCDRSLLISESRSSNATLEFAKTPAQISSALYRSSFSVDSSATNLRWDVALLGGVTR